MMMYLSDLIFILGCMTFAIYMAVVGILISGVIVRRARLYSRTNDQQ